MCSIIKQFSNKLQEKNGENSKTNEKDNLKEFFFSYILNTESSVKFFCHNIYA